MKMKFLAVVALTGLFSANVAADSPLIPGSGLGNDSGGLGGFYLSIADCYLNFSTSTLPFTGVDGKVRYKGVVKYEIRHTDGTVTSHSENTGTKETEADAKAAAETKEKNKKAAVKLC
jgi:hypothetical protein